MQHCDKATRDLIRRDHTGIPHFWGSAIQRLLDECDWLEEERDKWKELAEELQKMIGDSCMKPGM